MLECLGQLYIVKNAMNKPYCLIFSLCAVLVGYLIGYILTPAVAEESPPISVKTVASISTVYPPIYHSDLIVSRLFLGNRLDGKEPYPSLKLGAIYVEQFLGNDLSRGYASTYGFPIVDSIHEALTLGTGKLAVDGVLLIAERGDYPRSDLGITQLPKRRFFEEIIKVFRDSDRVVPIFCDMHIANNWEDAHWIVQTAREMEIPLMAGSSVPVGWRHPETDVIKDSKLKEIVALSYHTLDGYGFHALEMVQTLAERRQGGETGIVAVQCLTGDAVWQAIEKGTVDRELLADALALCNPRLRSTIDALPKRVRQPAMFVIEYADGLKAHVLTLENVVNEWISAWRYADDTTDATVFRLQEPKPAMHFYHLLAGIEKMIHTGAPTWNADRTLMTSGLVFALLTSKRDDGRRVETPHLKFAYSNTWTWCQPAPPPPAQPRQR